MEKDLNRAKQMIMYSNDAVEASYLDGSKIFLSPCASEYVVQQGSHNQGSFWQLVNSFLIHLYISFL